MKRARNVGCYINKAKKYIYFRFLGFWGILYCYSETRGKARNTGTHLLIYYQHVLCNQACCCCKHIHFKINLWVKPLNSTTKCAGTESQGDKEEQYRPKCSRYVLWTANSVTKHGKTARNKNMRDIGLEMLLQSCRCKLVKTWQQAV
jgi:hypothetical protein